MKSTSKAAAKAVKPVKTDTGTGTCCPKDGHGAHWHVVGWLAAVALVLSASTMTLGASASTGTVNENQAQLDRIEAKLDLIEQHLGTAQ